MMYRGAVISTCGQYRYELSRIWDDTKPEMVFCMMNPSTADATQDDATIRRCIGFAKREQCGGIRVVNVMAYRATDPAELSRAADAYGPLNQVYMESACRREGARLVVAWGAPKGGYKLLAHYNLARLILRKYLPMCFGTTLTGDPKHPLYLPSNAVLRPWTVVVGHLQL